MDTDKLNRELQIYRNHVKICRENVIHKLVRDIKFWKTKQESQTNNKRATKKVESLELIFSFIRSQSASDLAKAVIRFNPKQDVAGGSLSTEQRAIMRFHENKKLQPETKALIRKFGLKSKMDVLDKYLKSAKESKSKSRKKKIDKKSKKKGMEQDSEDQGFCEVDNPPETEEEIVSDEANETSKFVKTAQISVKKSDSKKSKRKVVKSPSKVQNEKKTVKPPDEEDDGEENCVKIQDSFFVTSSGQSYVATAPVVDSKQLEKEYKSWKRSNKRKEVFGKKEDKSSGKTAAVNDLHSSWKAKQQQKAIPSFQGKRKHFGEDEVDKDSNQLSLDLHPSWAAKQKQKTLQPFLGKKTKFDSTESAEIVDKTSGQDLHPSWAAKQKQKGIKPFVGKKIVFDSSEPTTAASPSTSATSRSATENKTVQPVDLHPSWAAKQKEKGIKEFQGKKITFDD
ncbi:uncharacterized protein LOC129727636 [Wyeomyia smithii]|uniref:uncharacterized protein LOC129727636 n=1 Tax=Wyeomyia smithii TaxID=174621 RepID=UPI002467E72F|nr:uncharacterized protein LOC129727636 [Wyeomyia smithii]